MTTYHSKYLEAQFMWCGIKNLSIFDRVGCRVH